MIQLGSDMEIAVGIIHSSGRVLVGRRPANAVLGGRDEFPGGKVEADESAEQAVVRECREETGLNVRVLRLRAEVEHCYDHGNLRLHFYDCEIAEPQVPRPPFRWVELAELATLRFPPANDAVVKSLCLTDSREIRSPR